jgi:hypothetical protein
MHIIHFVYTIDSYKSLSNNRYESDQKRELIIKTKPTTVPSLCVIRIKLSNCTDYLIHNSDFLTNRNKIGTHQTQIVYGVIVELEVRNQYFFTGL